MKPTTALMMVACLVATTAQAATARQQCFSPADIEAAQAIEFQTQLMVVSDICADPTYNRFTQRNREAIVHYQRQMIDHFRRNGTAAAERAFDTYMTRLANEKALASGQQTVGQICQSAATLIATANSLGSADDFRRFIASRAVANQASYRTCKD